MKSLLYRISSNFDGIIGVNGRNNGGLSPAMMPKSSATQALLLGRGEYPQEGYGRIEIEDDDDENQSAGKKLFVKPNNFSRYGNTVIIIL